MASYVKNTNFTAKDSLPSGDPAKIVKGTEIDIEFTSIANAILSKADINSPSFTGTPTGPTASAGTNTNQLATTAFVNAALGAIYPVGSVYINATSLLNPSVLLGFGTWVEFGAGRVMVGLNASDTLFDTLEETGGSKDAVVVSHTHPATSTVTDSGHFHSINGANSSAGSVPGNFEAGHSSGATANTNSATTGISVATTVASAGVSGNNANIQPYITVRMWKRTA